MPASFEYQRTLLPVLLNDFADAPDPDRENQYGRSSERPVERQAEVQREQGNAARQRRQQNPQQAWCAGPTSPGGRGGGGSHRTPISSAQSGSAITRIG